MVKTIYEIKLRDVILLSETKSAKHLLKYKWMPWFVVRKKVEELTEQIFEKLGSQTIDDIREGYDRTFSIRYIQLLEALHKLLTIELNDKVKLNSLRAKLGEEPFDSDLNKTIALIKENTGIEIKRDSDVKRFEKKIEFVNDKHREIYPEKEIDETPKSIIQTIKGILSYVGENYNEDLRIMAYAEFKIMAIEKIKAEAVINNK